MSCGEHRRRLDEPLQRLPCLLRCSRSQNEERVGARAGFTESREEHARVARDGKIDAGCGSRKMIDGPARELGKTDKRPNTLDIAAEPGE